MTHLFIVAHPDDEVLGCCGTILKHSLRGDRVVVTTYSMNSKTREKGLAEKQETTHKLLGVSKSYFFDYEMMKFDKYDRHEMTRKAEEIIEKESPDIIYTHDCNDIHNDHRFLSQIVMEASKLPMRQKNGVKKIRSIYFMEIPSSTDWGYGFIPNSFTEVTKESIKMKEQLLLTYNDVIREVPHPRNLISFEALARYRGGQCGCEYAEAFKKVFELVGE